MERLAINLDDSLHEVLLKMAEDNPSALRIMMRILQTRGKAGLSYILQLDDMNIRGTQIFVGYKYHCEGDLERFLRCIQGRDPEMVRCINDVGQDGKYPHKAVTKSDPSGQRELLP